MPVSVTVQTVHPRKLAAVRREVAPGEAGSAWGPAVGKVWDFIRSQPGLRTDGHNIFLYHHPAQPGAPVLCDFGVEVTRRFEIAGEVYPTETPGGEAAVAVHRGPYDRMDEAYNAIDRWMAANRRESAGHSWEIYGDPTPDPARTETTVVHLLKLGAGGSRPAVSALPGSRSAVASRRHPGIGQTFISRAVTSRIPPTVHFGDPLWCSPEPARESHAGRTDRI